MDSLCQNCLMNNSAVKIDKLFLVIFLKSADPANTQILSTLVHSCDVLMHHYFSVWYVSNPKKRGEWTNKKKTSEFLFQFVWKCIDNGTWLESIIDGTGNYLCAPLPISVNVQNMKQNWVIFQRKNDIAKRQRRVAFLNKSQIAE